MSKWHMSSSPSHYYHCDKIIKIQDNLQGYGLNPRIYEAMHGDEVKAIAFTVEDAYACLEGLMKRERENEDG